MMNLIWGMSCGYTGSMAASRGGHLRGLVLMAFTLCFLPEQRNPAKAFSYAHGQFALKGCVYRSLYDGLDCAA